MRRTPDPWLGGVRLRCVLAGCQKRVFGLFAFGDVNAHAHDEAAAIGQPSERTGIEVPDPLLAVCRSDDGLAFTFR